MSQQKLARTNDLRYFVIKGNVVSNKQEVQAAVKLLLQNGFRLSPASLPILMQTSSPLVLISKFLEQNGAGGGKVIGMAEILKTVKVLRVAPSVQAPTIDQRIPSEVQYSSVLRTPSSQLQGLHNFESQLEVTWEPVFSGKRLSDISDFTFYFKNRYEKLSKIIRGKRKSSSITQIRKLASLKERDEVIVIGMVTSKQFPASGGGIIELEDPYSETVLSVVVSKKDESLVNQFLMVMDDTVIGVEGKVINEERIAATALILPDIPRNYHAKTADVPVHAAFLSDIHIGSKGFLSKPFERFIKFLNGEYGNSKIRKLGLQTKYVMFAGDVVDGVGIFPNQEDELSILDVREQYNTFASFLEKIPEDVSIVVIPGNHDHVRPAEPQPIIEAIYAPELHGLQNVKMLPNPSQVSLHGVRTLLYHCTSLPDILNHLPGLKTEKPSEVMIKMLQARHLAPVWGSRTPIAPEPEDNLVINSIPDIFHGGHIHINDMALYNGVRILNSGTMQSQTSYQKALNIVPTPGEVLVVNLMDLTPNLLKLM